ncbi:helix-turn-helix domain-containing protein [Streptomyces sp. NBC_00525]|uniref:helix-turn-helix domain-containing protein n=1 Tax=Streptomyces sp. NBC_00525 TaxID=2903660 RepID=UPI002E80F123|nr:helix-turn-helix transcriptional regulator [Streptomyces sp. NBC_00525]WUC97668.1 helix-turn-helix domain-containing protein [Streptomyces sp. NBC_00525]
MSVDAVGKDRNADNDTAEHGWDVDPEDESGVAVVAAVGRQLKAWREAARLRAAEFGAVIGYGEDLVYKVEGGRRIPRPEYMDKADDALGANGKIAVMKQDLAVVRYPKKVRDLAKMEAQAVELAVYAEHGVHGLLQTEGHARALLETRQPSYSRDEVERGVAARLARRAIFDRTPAPALSFVLEEAALRRPIGGVMEWRRQLERLLAIAHLRNVSLQIMPLNCETHPGLDGGIEVLKFGDGTAVGRSWGAFNGRPVTEPKQLRILELRYGMIRAQALTPAESLAFIERVLGET